MRAALVVVGLAALAAMEFETPPRTTKPVQEPLARTTVGLGVSRDTLTAADRLEIPHAQQAAPAQSISLIEPIAPPIASPGQAAGTAQDPPKITEQRRRGAGAAKLAVMLPRPRPKHRISRTVAGTDRPKAIVEVKSCRPGAFDGLLKALNLSRGCET